MIRAVLITVFLAAIGTWLIVTALAEHRRNRRRRECRAETNQALADLIAGAGVGTRIRLHQVLCEADALGIDVQPYLAAAAGPQDPPQPEVGGRYTAANEGQSR